MTSDPNYILATITFLFMLAVSKVVRINYRANYFGKEKKYKTFWPRVWANFVDMTILYPILYIILFVFLIKGLDLTFLIFLWISYHLFPFTYSIAGHYKFGFTFGKYASQVKVVDNKSEKPISLKQALIRDAVPIFITLLTLWIWWQGYPSSGFDFQTYTGIKVHGGWQEFIGYLVLLWSIAEIITMLSNKKRRAIHDFLAGTVVVRVKVDESKL